jgi:hypothetical protein
MINLKKTSQIITMAAVTLVCGCIFLLISSLCIYFIAIKGFSYDILSLSSINTSRHVDDSQMVIFPNLHGPITTTSVLQSKATSWQKYHEGGTNTFAVFLTDTTSDFLGLVHAFKSFGIPISLHTDLKEALTHKIVLLYPIATNDYLNTEKIKDLNEYVNAGGTLLGTNVKGAIKTLFGIRYNRFSQTRFSAKLTKADTSLMKDFKLSEEKEINFGNKKDYKIIFESYGYIPSSAQTLIQFEDSTSLLTSMKAGKGKAIAVGLDLGEFFLRCQNSRGFNAGRTYVNGFEPGMDVFMRILKTLYLRNETAPVVLGTVPYNKLCTIVLTHDIDYSLSIENAVGYAEMEHRMGVRASYFIQTKYIKDWNDTYFFTPKGINCLKKIAEYKMEIASHSVAHSRSFSEFNYGTGKEQYPEYRPFVKEKKLTMNGSITGELRVSKFLLEYFLPGIKVTSFRAGHLSNPYALPEALTATAYLNSSNETANNCLTHLPFQLNFNRTFTQELPIFEYPVTIEDEEKPGLAKRVNSSIALIDKISLYGGLVCILIHTDTFGEKLKFEEDIIKAYKNKAHFTTLNDFNAWWTIRNEVKISVEKSQTGLKLLLLSPQKIDGLCLEIPAHWHLQKQNLGIERKGNTLLFPQLNRKVELYFFTK